jgi:hypothetical protein
MFNFFFGILIGWLVFTSTGRESAMIAYYYMDRAGAKISERVQEDLPKPVLPTKREWIETK